jgi:hypothetical protein
MATNIQEVQEALYQTLIYFNAAAECANAVVDIPDGEETREAAFEWSKKALSWLGNEALKSIQILAFIICEHFDNEYLMSGYDVVHEFDENNYFLNITMNDDHSLRISAYKEKKNENRNYRQSG